MTTAIREKRLAIFEPEVGGDRWAVGRPAQRPPVWPADVGGKAAGLLRIADAGLATPPWFAVLPGSVGAHGSMSDAVRAEIDAACRRLEDLGAESFAIRSSALDEDGSGRSFAGQYWTSLDVRGLESVLEAIAASVAWAERGGADAYRTAHRDAPGRRATAVIVQQFERPVTAGVAFGRDPLTGADEVVITATRLPEASLSVGESTGDEYRVLADERVLVRPAGDDPGTLRVLSDKQARALAGAARLLEQRLGEPQDIEWLYAGTGELRILQTRPITALPGVGVADGPVRLWDNANIVESFPELTLPLTFSVAAGVYAVVYRRACLSLGVPRAVVERESAVFDQMLGLLQGRVYYDLASWYRVLALLPGFRLTAGFLEAMMGARQPGSGASERSVPVAARAARWWEIARMTLRLSYRLIRIRRDIDRFQASVGYLLARHWATPRPGAPAEALLADFVAVRDGALRRWNVPIMNDLFLMLANGALRRSAARWLGEDAQGLVTSLLVSGGVASARPGDDLLGIAAAIRERAAWRSAVLSTPPELLLARLAGEPGLAGASVLIDGYLARWGERAPRELQLERQSYSDDPMPLIRALRVLVSDPPERQADASIPAAAEVERRLRAGRLGGLRLAAFTRLLRATRRHIRWREELRLLRGQVFGVGRRIFRRLGEVLHERGVLERAEDVHYLTLDELEGLVRGTGVPGVLRSLVRLRRERYEDYASRPRLPSRFETRGTLTDPLAIEPLAPLGAPARGVAAWRGIGAARGRVKAPCLVVEDPARSELLPGRIVVARTTDPGWVPILVGVAGLLVEQGSLLSHSAIIARELGIPTVVGLAGLVDQVRTGEVLELDGSTGEVTLVARAEGAP